MKRLIFFIFCFIQLSIVSAQDNTQITKILESLITNKVYEGDKTFFTKLQSSMKQGILFPKN
jgi:hypothetical protein